MDAMRKNRDENHVRFKRQPRKVHNSKTWWRKIIESDPKIWHLFGSAKRRHKINCNKAYQLSRLETHPTWNVKMLLETETPFPTHNCSFKMCLKMDPELGLLSSWGIVPPNRPRSYIWGWPYDNPPCLFRANPSSSIRMIKMMVQMMVTMINIDKLWFKIWFY
jgi:hypothetical protein